MNTTVTLDEAGRVVIPRGLREGLHLSAGDILALESEGECITLRPVHATGAMCQERGVWVFRIGQVLAARVADETLDRVRGEREAGSEGDSP